MVFRRSLILVLTLTLIGLAPQALAGGKGKRKKRAAQNHSTPPQLAEDEEFGRVKIKTDSHKTTKTRRYKVDGWRLLAFASSGQSVLALWPEDFLRSVAPGTGNALSNPRKITETLAQAK